jgi:hypothetical protein
MLEVHHTPLVPQSAVDECCPNSCYEHNSQPGRRGWTEPILEASAQTGEYTSKDVWVDCPWRGHKLSEEGS